MYQEMSPDYWFWIPNVIFVALALVLSGITRRENRAKIKTAYLQGRIDRCNNVPIPISDSAWQKVYERMEDGE